MDTVKTEQKTFLIWKIRKEKMANKKAKQKRNHVHKNEKVNHFQKASHQLQEQLFNNEG